MTPALAALATPDPRGVGGLVALSTSPAEFTQFIEAETVKFRTLVTAAHLST